MARPATRSLVVVVAAIAWVSGLVALAAPYATWFEVEANRGAGEDDAVAVTGTGGLAMSDGAAITSYWVAGQAETIRYRSWLFGAMPDGYFVMAIAVIVARLALWVGWSARGRSSGRRPQPPAPPATLARRGALLAVAAGGGLAWMAASALDVTRTVERELPMVSENPLVQQEIAEVAQVDFGAGFVAAVAAFAVAVVAGVAVAVVGRSEAGWS